MPSISALSEQDIVSKLLEAVKEPGVDRSLLILYSFSNDNDLLEILLIPEVTSAFFTNEQAFISAINTLKLKQNQLSLIEGIPGFWRRALSHPAILEMALSIMKPDFNEWLFLEAIKHPQSFACILPVFLSLVGIKELVSKKSFYKQIMQGLLDNSKSFTIFFSKLDVLERMEWLKFAKTNAPDVYATVFDVPERFKLVRSLFSDSFESTSAIHVLFEEGSLTYRFGKNFVDDLFSSILSEPVNARHLFHGLSSTGLWKVLALDSSLGDSLLKACSYSFDIVRAVHEEYADRVELDIFQLLYAFYNVKHGFVTEQNQAALLEADHLLGEVVEARSKEDFLDRLISFLDERLASPTPFAKGLLSSLIPSEGLTYSESLFALKENLGRPIYISINTEGWVRYHKQKNLSVCLWAQYPIHDKYALAAQILKHARFLDQIIASPLGAEIPSIFESRPDIGSAALNSFLDAHNDKQAAISRLDALWPQIDYFTQVELLSGEAFSADIIETVWDKLHVMARRRLLRDEKLFEEFLWRSSTYDDSFALAVKFLLAQYQETEIDILIATLGKVFVKAKGGQNGAEIKYYSCMDLFASNLPVLKCLLDCVPAEKHQRLIQSITKSFPRRPYRFYSKDCYLLLSQKLHPMALLSLLIRGDGRGTYFINKYLVDVSFLKKMIGAVPEHARFDSMFQNINDAEFRSFLSSGKAAPLIKLLPHKDQLRALSISIFGQAPRDTLSKVLIMPKALKSYLKVLSTKHRREFLKPYLRQELIMKDIVSNPAMLEVILSCFSSNKIPKWLNKALFDRISQSLTVEAESFGKCLAWLNAEDSVVAYIKGSRWYQSRNPKVVPLIKTYVTSIDAQFDLFVSGRNKLKTRWWPAVSKLDNDVGKFIRVLSFVYHYIQKHKPRIKIFPSKAYERASSFYVTLCRVNAVSEIRPCLLEFFNSSNKDELQLLVLHLLQNDSSMSMDDISNKYEQLVKDWLPLSGDAANNGLIR
jgi:hypothetical protein